MPTGTVWWLTSEVKARANINSFQAAMKQSSPVVTTAGRDIGRMILKKIVIGLAPSIRAASRTGRRQLLVSHMNFILRAVIGLQNLSDGFLSIELSARK